MTKIMIVENSEVKETLKRDGKTYDFNYLDGMTTKDAVDILKDNIVDDAKIKMICSKIMNMAEKYSEGIIYVGN